MESVEIKLGKYKINNLVAEHWAIKIGDIWYEVEGVSKEQDGNQNKIKKHKDDSKYTTICLLGTLDNKSNLSESFIEKIINEWLEKHPFYRFNGDNCQLFVKHMAWHLLGISIETQNATVGNMVFGASIGAIIVGAFGIAAGLFIKGSH